MSSLLFAVRCSLFDVPLFVVDCCWLLCFVFVFFSVLLFVGCSSLSSRIDVFVFIFNFLFVSFVVARYSLCVVICCSLFVAGCSLFVVCLLLLVVVFFVCRCVMFLLCCLFVVWICLPLLLFFVCCRLLFCCL